MSSIKCPHCGLVNYSTAVTCKRCANDLTAPAGSALSNQQPYAPDNEGHTAATTISDSGPPRTLGILLAVLGAALSLGGVYLLSGGATPYFLVVGVGIAASGVLIAAGKRAGMYLYFATFAMMCVWSLLETGGDAKKMLSRLALAALIGLYLCTERVRGRLS